MKAHATTDRFCRERTGEWNTGRTCPVCRPATAADQPSAGLAS